MALRIANITGSLGPGNLKDQDHSTGYEQAEVIQESLSKDRQDQPSVSPLA